MTGRVIRRATASPVSSASSAASPAAPAMARSSAVCRLRSAALSPEPVDRTSAVPARWSRTTIGRLECEPSAVAKAGEAATTVPAWSRICTAVPVVAARSRTDARSAPDQVLFRSHAAPAETATALASAARCWLARLETSAAANAAVSPASSATAASATLRKASASRRPSVPPRGTASIRTPSGCIASGGGAAPACAVPGGAGPGSVIAGQAEAVTAAEHGLHDLGVAGILLDLAAQVLHVRVDGALVPFELVPAHPVDQLEPGVHPARDGGQRREDPPLGGGQRDRRAAQRGRRLGPPPAGGRGATPARGPVAARCGSWMTSSPPP